MLDLIIRNGEVVDGTGAPRRRADIAIRGDRIVAVGEVTDRAHQVIDAAGQAVTPGFVDVHTHYDAQVFWDGTLSPSCYHGVTSVVAGNCGFSIAPLSGKPADSHYLLHMLARVEGMPVESLEQGVPWDWKGFGQFLGKLDGKVAINCGFMVGHSAIRRAIMGDRAVGHPATAADLDSMRQLLATSLAEGGLGFSTTVSPTHSDADGAPVPSRHATTEELLALARVVRQYPGTTLEFLPGVGPFTEADMQRMTDMSVAAGRPLNWNLLSPDASRPQFAEHQMSASDYAAARGGRVVGLAIAQPMVFRVNFQSMFLLDSLPGWEALVRMTPEQRIEALRDPASRATLEADANSQESGLFSMLLNWPGYTVVEVFSDENRAFAGKTVGEVAAMTGRTPFDALLDITVADRLKTSFALPAIGGDEESWRLRAKAWVDGRTVIGGSDAGAHLDMIDTFAFSTQVLGGGVRERGLLSLEAAVQQLTSVPAGLVGLTDRGVIRPGAYADLVVLDPDRIATGPTYTRFDLPGGAGRLYADAIGISHVVVNGREAIRDNRIVDGTAGRVLRSGRDTHTVAVPAAAE